MRVQNIVIFGIALWLLQYEEICEDGGKDEDYYVVEWCDLRGYLFVDLVVVFDFERANL